MVNINLGRRHLVCQALAAATVGELFGSRLSFADSPSLDPNDPTAKALGYITQSTKADQKCSNCTQYQGKGAAAQGPCAIFPGKNVAAAGWCTAWVNKPL